MHVDVPPLLLLKGTLINYYFVVVPLVDDKVTN